MAKKSLGKFLAFATISGAVAAGISYFLKYKSFNKELDKDFHDFEGDGEDDFDGSLPHESEDSKRNYVTLGEKKTETENTEKEAATQISDSLADAADSAKEAVQTAAQEVKEAVETAAETPETTIIEEDSSIQ